MKNPADMHQMTAILLKDKTREQLTRRMLIANYLINGRTYIAIEEELNCSSALIADVAKKLRESGVLK